MALLPMGPRTDEIETQESMFDEPTDFADPEFDEVPEELESLEAAEAIEDEIDEEFPETVVEVAEEPSLHSYAPEVSAAHWEPELHSLEASVPEAPGLEAATPQATEPQLTAESAPIWRPDPSEQPHPETHSLTATVEPEPDASTLPLTSDDFAGLEERVLRAVNPVRRERLSRTEAEGRVALVEERAAAAEARVSALEAQIEAQSLQQNPLISQLQQEVDSLRTEREQVRLRVERLLSQLDALEL